MKLIKTTSLLSLVGLLALAVPQSAQAGGGKSGSFLFPPFGLVTLNIKMEEPLKGQHTRQARLDTQALLQLCVDAVNSNEGFFLGTNELVLPPGAYLWFDGFDFHIKTADGSEFLNLTDSPNCGNYLSMSFSNVVVLQGHEQKGKISENDLASVTIVFNATPSLCGKTSLTGPPHDFTLTGTIKLHEGNRRGNLDDNGTMTGFGSGDVFGGIPLGFSIGVDCKWSGTIEGQGVTLD